MIKNKALTGLLLALCITSNACTGLGEGPFVIQIEESAAGLTDVAHSAASILEEMAECHLFLFDGEPDIRISSRAPRDPSWIAARTGNSIEIYTEDAIDEYVMAHELLHVLGFEHVDDPDNLMYEFKRTFGAHELNAEQLEMLKSFCR